MNQQFQNQSFDCDENTFGWKNNSLDDEYDNFYQNDNLNLYNDDCFDHQCNYNLQNESVSSTSTSSDSTNSDDEDRSAEHVNDDAEESYATVLYHTVQDAISEARAKGQADAQVERASCNRYTVASVAGVVSACIVATAVSVASSPYLQGNILALVNYACSWF